MSFIDTKSDFSGMLPVMQVDTVDDPRRSEVRVAAPMVLWEVDDAGIARELRFEIELERYLGRCAAPAVVVNCTTSGLCVVSTAFAQPGTAVHITASDALSQEVLFREPYLVCGRRRAGDIATIVRGSGAVTGSNAGVQAMADARHDTSGTGIAVHRDEYRYALRLDHAGHSQVFKSYLFSLLHEFLRDQPDVDLASLTSLIRQAAGRTALGKKKKQDKWAGLAASQAHILSPATGQ